MYSNIDEIGRSNYLLRKSHKRKTTEIEDDVKGKLKIQIAEYKIAKIELENEIIYLTQQVEDYKKNDETSKKQRYSISIMWPGNHWLHRKTNQQIILENTLFLNFFVLYLLVSKLHLWTIKHSKAKWLVIYF